MQVSRRVAREWAIQMLTAADLNPPEDILAFILEFWSQLATLAKEDGGGVPSLKYKLFAEERVRGVLDNLKAIDEVLVPQLENWDLYRLGTVERAVLRMGIWELKYAQVPAPVAINEAVDLVNWYSGPKSRALVNGILDKIAKQ